jgi:hypothetical protein
MAHPAEHYVKFYLASKWGQEEFLEINAINQSLQVLGLPGLLGYHYNDIFSRFYPPPDFCITSRFNEVTARFMEEHKITAMWKEDPELKTAIDEIIIKRPQLQFRINVMLLGRVPNQVIAERLSERFSVLPALSERMIELYKHYFWKVDCAGYEEWDNILCSSVYRDHYMSSLHNGESQALWRAGFSPKVDVKKALKETQKHIYFRLKALEAQPSSKEVLDQSIRLSRELRALYSALHSEGDGLPESLRELSRFLMRHDAPDVKELEHLVNRGDGGGFSEDGGVQDIDSKEPIQ